MTRVERSRSVADTVAGLAARAFIDFKLTWRAETKSWRCSNPKNGMHSFSVYTAPGVVVVWGDLGDYIINHSDADSLGWLVRAAAAEDRYPDYFLGKLVAMGGPKMEFYAGDALALLDERIAEIKSDRDKDIAELEDDGGFPAGEKERVVEEASRRIAKYETVRSEFLDDDMGGEAGRTASSSWYLAWSEGLDDSDPPNCEAWSSGALWLWHAVRTFARLYASRSADAPGPAEDAKRRPLVARVPVVERTTQETVNGQAEAMAALAPADVGVHWYSCAVCSTKTDASPVLTRAHSCCAKSSYLGPCCAQAAERSPDDVQSIMVGAGHAPHCKGAR